MDRRILAWIKVLALWILKKTAELTAIGIIGAMYLAGVLIFASFAMRPFSESIRIILEGLTSHA